MHSGTGSPRWTGGDGVCHVYGHKTPDSDAVCSSLAYAALMRELGYDCEAFVSSKTNNETNFISSYFGFDLPEVKPSVPKGTRQRNAPECLVYT